MRAAWLLLFCTLCLLGSSGCSSDPPPPGADAGATDRPDGDDVFFDGPSVPPDGNPNKLLLCEAACARQAAVMCAGFTMDGCVARCTSRFAGTPSRCRTEADGVLRCVASFAEYTCGPDGLPVTTDCAAEEAELRRCTSGGDAQVDDVTEDAADVAAAKDADDVPAVSDVPAVTDVEDVSAPPVDVFDAAVDAATPDAADVMDVTDAADAPRPVDAVDVAQDAPVDLGPQDRPPTLTCPPPTATITLPGAVFTRESATSGASDIPATRCRPDTTGPEQSYALTVTARTGVVIDTEGASTGFDTVLSVRRDCDDARTELLCDDDTGRATTSSIRAILDPGSYSVLVDGVGGASGRYSLRARSFTPAANSVCAGAVALMPGMTLGGQSTVNGGLRDAACRATEGGPLFYQVTVPPASRVVVRATPTGAPAWAPALAVAGDCVMRTCLTTSAGETAGAASSVSLVNTGTIARTFVVSVASTTTVDGTFDLAATAAMPIPRGTTCDTALALTNNVALQRQDTNTGFVSGAALCQPAAAGPQLYYSISIPARQRASIRVTPTSAPAWTPTVRVLSFCTVTTCAASTTASAPGNTASLTFDNPEALPLTVILAVAGASPTATGVFDILVSLAAIPMSSTCEAPTALMSGVMVSGNTLNGMRSGAALCEPTATGGQLYYSLRIPPMQRATVRVTPTGAPAWRPTIRVLESCMATACLQSATASGVGAEVSLVFDNPSAAMRDVIVTLAGATIPPGGAFTMTATLAAIEPPPYTVTTVTSNCDELTASSAVAPPDGWNDDTATDPLPLPFAFQFFTTRATHWTASSNGLLEFWTSATGESLAQSTNRNVPNVAAPNGFAAPFWDDLIPADETADVRVTTFGAVPNRRFVVQWRSWQVLGAPATNLNFQVKLFETTRVIEFHYCSVTPAGGPAYGNGATIGVEDFGGTRGVEIAYNRTNAIMPLQAFRLTPR